MIRILIADDREENRYFLETLLKSNGYGVDSAVNGAEALAKARQTPPQLIISDLLMPVMDGYTLLQLWRADDRLKAVPFVVYTATYTTAQDEQLALSLGASAFILKPVEPAEFITRIRGIIAVTLSGGTAEISTPGPTSPTHIPVAVPEEEDARNLRLYSEVLIHKLEDKMKELDQANRELQRDIAERQQTERHIQQLNRVYSVLSDVNETIVREQDPQAMLKAVCRIAVEKGKFRMAWIGMFQPETQTLHAVASGGVVDGYTDLAKFNLKDQTNTTGPAARCFLSGQHAVCNDIAHDPLFLPWRDEAMQRGYQSSGGFPLKVAGQAIGIFSLYAGEPDFFNEEELRLLDDLAMDISFALEVGQREQERQQAEDELRWKTAFFEAQVDSSPDGILVVNHQGIKILQNQRMNELWKIPPDIAGGKDDAQQIQFVASRAKNSKEFVEKITHLNSHPDEISRDEIALVDGMVLDRYSSPVRDKAGKYYGRIWIFRDITQRLELEAQFRQVQKLEGIGQLAAGVAHDFNNILAIIQLQAGLLQTDSDIAPQQRESAGEIEKATERAANLTRQLLLFSRKQTPQTRELDLNQSINDMTKMLRRTIGEDIQVQFKFTMEPLLIRADAGMMDQVLMNLAVNARDAMPKGGQLVIETAAVEFDESVRGQSPLARPGSFVCLSVGDTGCGIPPENLSRIFEPFFTTKEVGKGTGLGLATVFGIIQQHQGWINVYSAVGRGTTFRIYLPRLAAQSGQESGPSALTAVRGGTETILLVEDEEALRASMSTALSQLGYRVLESASGVETLKIWAQHSREIDLLLTDMVMPGGMTGKELAGKLMREKPKIKVIYASGYSVEVASRDFPLTEGVNFITKPFGTKQLAQTVRNCLDREVGGD
jgi:signal transduction histidine kinase/DNA-binding response OmpR family regulator